MRQTRATQPSLAFGVPSLPSTSQVNPENHQPNPRMQSPSTFRFHNWSTTSRDSMSAAESSFSSRPTTQGFSRWSLNPPVNSDVSPFAGSNTAVVFGQPGPLIPGLKIEVDEVGVGAPHNELCSCQMPGLPAVIRRDQMQEDYQTEMLGDRSLIPCSRDVITSRPKVPAIRRSLSSFDIPKLSESKVLFYFGVLAIQGLLLPRFQYTRAKGKGMWACKLTMYGHTFEVSHTSHTKVDAKGEICRKALGKLQRQFPNWTVPEEPLSGVSYGWDWVEILRDYCIHNGLPAPEYTRYRNDHGCRHVVEVANITQFGALKHYTRDWESRNAAAHMAIYTLLVSENESSSSLVGPIAVRRFDESLLALVPREHVHVVETTGSENDRPMSERSFTKRPADDSGLKTAGGQSKKAKKKARRVIQNTEGGNANLFPLADNVRLQPVEEPEETEEKRWRVTPEELESKLNGLGTHTEKLQEVCQLLSLEIPEIRTVRSGQLMETNGDYKAGAYFREDPFLARASPVGQIEFKGTESEAKEACAREVIQYLITMVREDTLLETLAAAERNKLKNWGSTTL